MQDTCFQLMSEDRSGCWLIIVNMPKSFYVPSELVVIVSLYNYPERLQVVCESNPQGAGIYK